MLCTPSAPGDLLQAQLVESKLRDRTAKPRILFLKIFHTPRLINLPNAFLREPAAIGILADLRPAASVCYRLFLRQHNLGLTQLADNSLRRMFLE